MSGGVLLSHSLLTKLVSDAKHIPNFTQSANLRQPGWATMKVRYIIRLIEEDGWHLIATRGSHRQYKHPRKPGRVTIAGNLSDDLAPGTLNSILKQAGLKEQH